MIAALQTPFYAAPLGYGVRWLEVKAIGRIAADHHRSGNPRFRVVIESKGELYRISRRQIAPGLEVPFTTREAAEEVLDGIRHLLAKGYSIPHAISQFLPMYTPEDLVENRLAEYLIYFERLVEQGKRSPSTLREMARYAAPGGHFSYWAGANARELTFAQVEDWHAWLGARGIGLKTQKNVSDSFRAFLRRLRKRSEIGAVPEFPPVEVPEYAPTLITMEQQAKILAAIPLERRGLFLCKATEALRLSEARALEIGDYVGGTLRVTKTIQGKGRSERVVPFTKNRSQRVKEIWSPDLIEWLDWRVAQSTAEERLRGEVALFPNPTARNVSKRWGISAAEREWERACDAAWIHVSLQEGTRHCILTKLGAEMPQMVLQAFSGHRDSRSLDHYAKPRATKAAIRRITGGGEC